MVIDKTVKVERFLVKEYQSIATDVIYEENGNYNLFNIYTIERKNKGYTVYKLKTATVKTFYKLKNAVAWCIFDRQNLILNSNRVEVLDNTLSGVELALEMHQKLYKKAKSNEDRFIYLAKLNEDKLKKVKISKELQGYIIVSDRLQRERFEILDR